MKPIQLFLSLLATVAVSMAEEKPDLNAALDLDDPAKVEERINGLIGRLAELRAKAAPVEVKDYAFKTAEGETSLSKLFGDRKKLLVIHNMGSGCNYCTLWADGFNGILPHLKDAMAVVMVSSETPEVQAAFAKGRNWGFAMASHKDLPYTKEQTTLGEWADNPGATVYEKIDGKIFLRNKCFFEPGDIYCSMWPLLGLAGIENKDWIPDFKYGPEGKAEDKASAE